MRILVALPAASDRRRQRRDRVKLSKEFFAKITFPADTVSQVLSLALWDDGTNQPYDYVRKSTKRFCTRTGFCCRPEPENAIVTETLGWQLIVIKPQSSRRRKRSEGRWRLKKKGQNGEEGKGIGSEGGVNDCWKIVRSVDLRCCCCCFC